MTRRCWVRALALLAGLAADSCGGRSIAGHPGDDADGDVLADVPFDTSIDPDVPLDPTSDWSDTMHDTLDTLHDPWDAPPDTGWVDAALDAPTECSLFAPATLFEGWPDGEMGCTVHDRYTSQPLFAPGAEPMLQMIGMYEGGPDGTVTLRLQRTYRPVILALSAYESIEWEIALDEGADLRQVILYGYDPQSVTGVPAGMVVNRSLVDGSPFAGYCWPWCWDGYPEDMAEAVADAEAIAGTTLASFAGCSGSAAVTSMHACREDCLPGIACEDRGCGWLEGCAISCGECPEGQACLAWQCLDCEPTCDGRECGTDGCEGSCGECPEGEVCNGSGSCMPSPYRTLCADVMSESHYCLTLTGDSAAFVGMDTGEVCEMEKWPGLFSSSWAFSFAFVDDRVHLCTDTPYARGIARIHITDGTWEVANHLCFGLTRWRNGLLALPAPGTGPFEPLMWFPDWWAAQAGEGWTITVDTRDHRMSATGDYLYTWWHATDHVTEWWLPSRLATREIYLEGYYGWINGLSVTDDGLIFLLGAPEDGIEVFDVHTGTFVERTPAVVDPDWNGLVCWVGPG